MKRLDHLFTDTENLIEFIDTNAFHQAPLVQIYASDNASAQSIFETIDSTCANPSVTTIVSESITQAMLHFTKLPYKADITCTALTASNPTKSHPANESMYAGIINTTTEGFWLLDSELNITDVNFSLCRMLGYKRDELIGKKPFDFIDAKDLEHCQSQAESINNISSRSYEIVFKTKKNALLPALVNATSMHDQDDKLVTFAFITDISKQKQVEDEFRSNQKSIEKLNNSLEIRIKEEVEKNRQKDHMMYQQSRLASMGEMIGNIAHQWRQPLNIMALVMQDIYISQQLGNLTPTKIEDSYEKSNNLLQYMSQTIDDFRNFFKHTEEEDEEFSIKDAVESVHGLVSTSLSYNNIECDINVMQDSRVSGSLNEFKQVLINLINNAQEAIQTKKGSDKQIIISIYQEDQKAYIRFNDDGGGMDKDVIQKVFDPYFTTKNQTQGTGLGLYMSKQIIENSMCGSLTAKNVDKGAEFTIALPMTCNKE